MKKYLYGLTLIVSLFCVFEDNSSAQNKKPLPTGWEYGKVESYQGKTTAEKNMLSQFNTYRNALMREDMDNFSLYIYKDAIKYFKRFAPSNYSDKDIINVFYKSVSGQLSSSIETFAAKGITIDMTVQNIVRKVTYENSLIYVFNITTNIYKEKMCIHSLPEKTIGISSNHGTNWTFLALNDDTPNILRMRFNQSIINQIMGY